MPSAGGHECTLSNEFLQAVERDVLYAEGSSYGTKVKVPEVKSI